MLFCNLSICETFYGSFSDVWITIPEKNCKSDFQVFFLCFQEVQILLRKQCFLFFQQLKSSFRELFHKSETPRMAFNNFYIPG